MDGAAEDAEGPLRPAICVELADALNAADLARELSSRFRIPPGVMERDGHWEVEFYLEEEENLFIVETIDAFERWLRARGQETMCVRVGEQAYVLEAN